MNRAIVKVSIVGLLTVGATVWMSAMFSMLLSAGTPETLVIFFAATLVFFTLSGLLTMFLNDAPSILLASVGITAALFSFFFREISMVMIGFAFLIIGLSFFAFFHGIRDRREELKVRFSRAAHRTTKVVVNCLALFTTIISMVLWHPENPKSVEGVLSLIASGVPASIEESLGVSLQSPLVVVAGRLLRDKLAGLSVNERNRLISEAAEKTFGVRVTPSDTLLSMISGAASRGYTDTPRPLQILILVSIATVLFSIARIALGAVEYIARLLGQSLFWLLGRLRFFNVKIESKNQEMITL